MAFDGIVAHQPPQWTLAHQSYTRKTEKPGSINMHGKKNNLIFFFFIKARSIQGCKIACGINPQKNNIYEFIIHIYVKYSWHKYIKILFKFRLRDSMYTVYCIYFQGVRKKSICLMNCFPSLKKMPQTTLKPAKTSSGWFKIYLFFQQEEPDLHLPPRQLLPQRQKQNIDFFSL